MSNPSCGNKLTKTEELKERLKKWREEKEAQGRRPMKRPLGQVNKPVAVVPNKKRIIEHNAKEFTVKKPTTAKLTAVVKPQVQGKGLLNQENVKKKPEPKQSTQETEDRRKKLDEWKRKKNEEKQSVSERNRRLTFIPSSGKATLPSITSQHKNTTNRRQTISTAKPPVGTSITTSKTPIPHGHASTTNRRQTISNPKPTFTRKSVTSVTSAPQTQVNATNRRQTMSIAKPIITRKNVTSKTPAPQSHQSTTNRRLTMSITKPVISRKSVTTNTPASQSYTNRRQTMSIANPITSRKSATTNTLASQSHNNTTNRRQTMSIAKPITSRKSVTSNTSASQSHPINTNRRQTISNTKTFSQRNVVTSVVPASCRVQVDSNAAATRGTATSASSLKGIESGKRQVSLTQGRRESPRQRRVVSTMAGGRAPTKHASVSQKRPMFSSSTSTAVGSRKTPIASAWRQSVNDANRPSKQQSVPKKIDSNLVRRHSPRVKNHVKRLSVSTSKPYRIKDSVIKRSLPPGAVQQREPPQTASSCAQHSLMEKLNDKAAKRPIQRKSILKPVHMIADPIEEENSQDLDKTPPVETRGAGVRFTIQTGTPRTPRTPGTASRRRSTVGLTPEMARRQQLNEWLAAKGKTPSRFRHLCCFDQQLSAKKKKVTGTKPGLSAGELAKQQSQLDEEVTQSQQASQKPVKIKSPPVKGKSLEMSSSQKPATGEKPAALSSTHETGSENITGQVQVDVHSDQELESMLHECTQLFEAGCPSESVLGWLDDIGKHYPQATTSAAYWICRATIIEEAGDDHVTVDIYEQACRNNAQPALVMVEALRSFVVRMEDRASRAKKAASTPRTQKEVQSKNAFKSSSIKFCISNTTPFFKKLHRRADREGTPMSVVTPVRRSTRRSLATLPDMLRDHDVIVETLEDVPRAQRDATLFMPNEALPEDADEREAHQVEPEPPIERSLAAELTAAADDGDDLN